MAAHKCASRSGRQARFTAWEVAADIEESSHVGHQMCHGGAPMVPGDGVVHLLPQPLDFIDPRVVGRLEQDLEFLVGRQPALDHLALVDDVVVGDERDTACRTVGSP